MIRPKSQKVKLTEAEVLILQNQAAIMSVLQSWFTPPANMIGSMHYDTLKGMMDRTFNFIALNRRKEASR